MKLTSHNARVDSSGLHNDRNFNLDDAPHIDKEKVKDNLYWTYNGAHDKPLKDLEMDFYKEHFSKYIARQNKRNKESGHKERNRTMKQFYKAAHTRPEDKIIQIGDMKEHPSPEVLWECALEYQRQFNEIFGENCKILDMSLHVDEATPHVHIRRVWMYEDELGQERVGQVKALEKLGILEKDTTKETGRYNNSKITFTAQDRQLFRDICLEKGIDLEPDSPARRKHLSVPEYKELAEDMEELELKRDRIREEIGELEEQTEDVKELCDSLDKFLTGPVFYNIHDEEVAMARKKNLAKRAAELTAMFKEEADKVVASEGSFRAMMEEAYNESKNDKLHKQINTLTHKVEILSSFIVEKGLGKELAEYAQKPKERENDSPHRNPFSQDVYKDAT